MLFLPISFFNLLKSKPFGPLRGSNQGACKSQKHSFSSKNNFSVECSVIKQTNKRSKKPTKEVGIKLLWLSVPM